MILFLQALLMLSMSKHDTRLKIIDKTRMLSNKVWYNPGRFSNVSVLPLGNDTIRVKYEPD